MKYYSYRSYYCDHFYHHHTVSFVTRMSLLRKQHRLPHKARKLAIVQWLQGQVVWEVAVTTWWGYPCGLISVTLNLTWCHVLKWVNIVGVLKKRCKYELYGLISCLNASLPVRELPIYSPHFSIKQEHSMKQTLNAVSGNLLSLHQEFDKLLGFTLPLSKSILSLSSINKLVGNLSISSSNTEGNVSHKHCWEMRHFTGWNRKSLFW